MKKILSYLVALSFVVLLRPSYTWASFLPGIAIILFSFIFFLNGGKISSKKNINLVVILFFICLYNLRHITPSSVLSFFIILVFLSNNQYKIYMYRFCKNLYTILIAISMVVFVLVVYAGVDLPNYVIDASNELKEYTYLQYPLLVVPNDLIHPVLTFRFCFLLDEPGAVGTLATLFLLIDDFSLKKWQNIVIFLSGVLSLSLFFFICSFFFLIVINKPSIKGLVSLLLIGVIIGIGFYYLSTNYSEVSELFENRLKIEDGRLSGDNRSDDSFDQAYTMFIERGDNLLFGMGEGAHNKIAPRIQTYKMIIYDNGFIYVFLVLLFYLFYPLSVLKKYPKRALLFIVFFWALYYQRPAYVFETAYFYLLLLVPIIWEQNNAELNIVPNKKTQ